MSKGGYYISACLQRIALPAVLITCVLARQTALTASYLLLLLVLPYVPLSSSKTITGATGHYLRCVVVVSFLNVAAQASFQIYLVISNPYGDFLEFCGLTERILRHVGFVRLDGISLEAGVLYIAPDVLALLGSISIYCCIRKLTRNNVGSRTPSDILPPPVVVGGFSFLATKARYLALVLLLVAGSLRPSVTSGVYYITFIGAVTWWASFRELGKSFVIVCRIVSVIAAAHALALLAYQTQYLQEMLDENTLYARLSGLYILIKTDCVDPRIHTTVGFDDWPTVVNPIAILVLYYVLALQGPAPTPTRESQDATEKGLTRTLSQRLSQRRLARNPTMRWRTGNRKVRLISTVGQGSRYRATSIGSGLKSDPHGSVIVTDAEQDAIPLNTLQNEEDGENSLSCLELIVDGVISIFQLLVRSSYIANNVIMMAWSITYHSWLTFLLLLTASVLWMIPNQRRTMLRCSPYIVVYAELLILSQYVFGMNLNDDELPVEVNGIKLDQIGFTKPKQLPVQPILIKTLFTVMFWITMRQYCQEQWEKRQTSALADLSAPFRVSVSTASAPPQREEGSAWVTGAGHLLQKLMVKVWIWVVAISLFVIGITGNRITVFRICYMALFLVFILTFQISYRAWRRMMYGFWLTVIIYSMSILVLVYTYQFDHFEDYWDYIGVDKYLQEDIGLERFQTTDLFIRLLSPTFFVIITVVQLHYFHKDFLVISDLRNRGASVSRSGKGSSRSEGSSLQPEDVAPVSTQDDEPLLGAKLVRFRSLRQLSSTEVKILVSWCKQQLLDALELIFLFLELHMLKIVLLSIMLLCCYNVTATHLVLVVLCVAACHCGSHTTTTIAHVSSVYIAFLFLLTMIYQIGYIKEDNYQTNCTDIIYPPDDKNENIFKANNSVWLGFKKAHKGLSLIELLKGYIGVCAVITAHSVIMTRQRIRRQETDRPKPNTLFPGINRDLADVNIRHCLKYLLNHGFYKFGVEICLMALVGVIGSRMDMYAIIYAVWLLGLFSLSRERLAIVWGPFTIFVACTISLQYLLVVGLPPGLCIDYPWYSSDLLRRVQKWAFLPDPIEPPSAFRIICDFILLVLVCRQSLCFRIERRHRTSVYGGGSNDVIIHDYIKPDFTNPYLDHMTHTRSWLDLVKKGVFSAMLWLTLAVTFTAGTSRVNIFSLGYLVGSFIFLWQGNDLYLRPVRDILRWWNWLLGYNVIVILIKAVLQIAGCIFINAIQSNTCWVVQLFGIGCISKFGDLGITTGGLAPPCAVQDTDIGLAWDGVCFGFLIMQRRFFNSYYFFHHIDETKAMTILQSRGAELIEELRQHQLQVQQEQERKVLEKIRHKMDRIKASQQKVQSKESASHFQEPEAPLACQSPGVSSQGTPRGYHTPISEDEPPRSFLQAPTPCSAILTVSLDGYLDTQRMSFGSPPASELNPSYHYCNADDTMFSRLPSPDESFPVFSPPPYGSVVSHHRHHILPPPLPPIPASWMVTTPRHSIVSQSSHHTSIRSGDYYMFDDIDDEELDLIKEDEDETLSEGDDMDTNRITMSKFLSTAMKTDITKAADQVLTADDPSQPARIQARRRASMPATMLRRKSSARRPPPASVLSAPGKTSVHSHRLRPTDLVDTPSISASESPRLSSKLPQPPPSEHPDDSGSDDDMKEAQQEPVKEKVTQRLWQGFKVLWAFMESCMVSMIRTMNRISRDYRYVVRVLAQEKRDLKDSELFIQGNRSGTSRVWKPRLEVMMHLSEIMTATSPHGSPSNKSLEGSTAALELSPPKDDTEKPIRHTLTTISEDPQQEKDVIARPVPNIRIIAASRERGLDSSAPPSSSEAESIAEEWSAANSPVWLQLLLSSWYAIISHSELVCYFAIFLHQINSPTLLSLPLPAMVFLWGSLTMPRPTKSFWVTLIAYTEVVVVVKFLFQFEIFPWNQLQAPDNNPFYPPRIIGIEKKTSYASSDLMLLLIIFFHRYMLKSLGLWKSTYEEMTNSLIQSSAYQPVEETKTTEIGAGGDWIQGGEDFSSGDILSRLQKSDSAETAEISPSQETVDTLETVVETKPRFKKTLICISASGDSDHSDEHQVVTRPSQGTFDKFPHYFREASHEYCSGTREFFAQLLDPGCRLSADVYAYMFICDFFNFLVVLFGFSAFGTQQGDGGVSSYLEENKVPIPFLLMMILQFALIVIDRALYLRKYILGKIVFQFLLVVGVHIWMFLVLPGITERPFNALLPPQMWYIVKCFYLLMSAYQIRAGYPARILGNFLCKKYNYFNMFSFRGFMAVPFLFELRALMDWVWTDTSMTLSDWLKMEDIFASIFQLKCQRRAELEYPLPRGQRKSPSSKYLLGGAGLFLIIAIIWFPLVLFALGNTVGESNIPYDVTITLRIGAYQYIYEMSAQNNTIYKYTEPQLEVFETLYKKDREALTFLSNYQYDDVAVVRLSCNSTVVWGISPPDRGLLLDEVESNQTLTIKFSWKLSRAKNNPENAETVLDERSVAIPAFVGDVRNPKRIQLADMLRANATLAPHKPLVIENIFPKFLKITNKGSADPLAKFMKIDKEKFDKDNATFRNVEVTLQSGISVSGIQQQWWEVRELCDDARYKTYLSQLPLNECRQFLTLFTFNDKKFPATLSFISGKGIIGLYVSIVFVMSTLVRGMFTGISTKIMFDDMPNVDRILQLCLDIYLVRESNEFALEEDLFAKLVFLYRSPETIIKWTRERELGDIDDDGEGSPVPSIAN